MNRGVDDNSRWWTMAPLVLAALLGVGCAPSTPNGRIALTSKTANPMRLDADFRYGGYVVEPGSSSIVLSTVPIERLQADDFESAQVIDITYLWEPRAGRTPVSRDATNLTIRHVVLVGRTEVGVYGGGGFGWPRGDPGDDGFGVDIAGSSLTLIDSTEGFRDLLSPASASGSAGGPLDATAAVRIRDAASQLVTNRLGRPRWVGPAPTPRNVARGGPMHRTP